MNPLLIKLIIGVALLIILTTIVSRSIDAIVDMYVFGGDDED